MMLTEVVLLIMMKVMLVRAVMMVTATRIMMTMIEIGG